jgi:hypothetical protein
MKDIRLIHNEAIEQAKKANVCLENKEQDNYLTLIEKAYILEQEAAMELVLKTEAEPTRSVLFRSAANLAYLCGKYTEANRLIHFALTGSPFSELKEELLELQNKVIPFLNIAPSVNEIVENAYLEYLKRGAINVRIEPKTCKFSKAIAVSYIIDFLKNIQQSYLNFSDIQFLKKFTINDFVNFDVIHRSFIQDTTLLGVDFKFNSFGISIVADTGTMNYNWTSSPKFSEFRNKLFPGFIEDVLEPDHNSSEFKKTILEKYNAEEIRKIYSPIIPSFIEKSPYRVSIANKDFTTNLKTFNPLTKETKLLLSPLIEKENDEDELSLYRKTEQKRGLKSKTIAIEKLKTAEFQIDISNIHFENKSVYLSDPHTIIINFLDNHYSINDEYFNIFTQGTDYNKILTEYYKLFIQKYNSLLSNRKSLNQTDESLLQKFETLTLRDW